MKRSIIFTIFAVVALSFGMRLHSQSVAGAKSVLQQLQQMKQTNAVLLEKQTALLIKLDELQKEAEQTKFMVKRG